MSTLMILWLIIAAVAALGLIVVEAWEYRHSSNYEPMTLIHLFQGLLLVFVPFVQVLTCLGTASYFLTTIAPKIVLFGKKR